MLTGDDVPYLINTENLEVREYQLDLYKKSLVGNSLIVLPTGLGKTAIAALIVAHKLGGDGCKILVLAPTKPLVNQLFRFFLKNIKIEKNLVASFTGEDSPEKRAQAWNSSRLVVSTPQAIRNDLISSKYSLRDVCLLIVDEAHRAVGDYPYVYIAKKYLSENPNHHIVGLSASPASSSDQLQTVCENLGIQKVYLKTRDDPDVKKYVQKVYEETVMVDPPLEFTSVLNYLTILLEKFVKPLKEESLIYYKDIKTLPLKKLIELQKEISQKVAKEGWTDNYRRHIMLIANSIRVAHAVNLLETQGVPPTVFYIRRVEEAARRRMSGSLRSLITDPFWVTSRIQLEMLHASGVIHPKLPKLVSLLEDHFRSGGKRAIVFTNYRDTADLIFRTFDRHESIKPTKFVGQANRAGSKGLSQKEQIEILEKFRQGYFNVLVATQVAEEGLDIPECDMVIMYDNVPSPLRLIQRVGRTGRVSAGRIVYLVTRHTRDEVYHYIARSRRRELAEAIKVGMRNASPMTEDKKPEPLYQESLYRDVELVVDIRETNSDVATQLSILGVRLRMEKLDVADYIVSDEICVERKTVEDFTSSIIDGRLFAQALNMRRSYKKPLFIVEGENLYSSTLNPESVRGALISLAVDYGLPLLWSRSPKDTALLLARIAAREQKEMGAKPIIRSSRKPADDDELKEYIVASLPGIDAARAKKLLSHFGSVSKVFNATVEELESVEGIGKVTAEKMRHIIEERYLG